MIEKKDASGFLGNFSVQWHSVLQGEYDPQSCINDIFNGGDGLTHQHDHEKHHGKTVTILEPKDSSNQAVQSPVSPSQSNHIPMNSKRIHRTGDILNEEDIRTDLRSWRVRSV